MTLIPVDDKTLAALTGPNELLAVTDAAGKVVGFFAPVTVEHVKEYVDAAAKMYSVWGAEGMPRHLTTPAEVIAHLEAREHAG
ncbi:MAG: hypothetical protein K2P78_02325 [Gemmataceae bacterium]|nr:hypothetical protein [Gemmataceae bacterium]